MKQAPPRARLQDVLINLVLEWLKKQLDFYVHYESRVQKLDKDVTSLQEARDRVQRKVDEEETRFGKQIDVFVRNWLEDVNKIYSEYEELNNDEDCEYAEFSGGFLPKWGIRRRLCINAEAISKKVTELLQKAPSHDKFSHWHGPPSIDAFLLNIHYVSFDSREKTMNDIMEALEDSSVRMIGVHGWSGVGKTTLVKEVAKKAREDKLFDVVIMANVTKNPDVIKIQGQIAEMLGMELEEKSDIGRAARIRKRLKSEKQNSLVILDDLRAELDFNMLGIPFANDDDGGKSIEVYSTIKAEKDAYRNMKAEKLPSAYNEMKTKETLSRYKGCKVLLISETKQVLMSQMDGKEESIFSVEVLKEKEAEMLFKTMAGIDDNSEFIKLAASIANMCGGLPMSIVTTARALKNQRHLVWEDVRQKLERQKLTGAPEFSTNLSYDLLENEELKYTFLLCASMGRDALIMDLVRYCIGLGFLQGIYTVREARDRVHVLVGKLKESHLLSESYSSDRFTMPDIVHHAASSIASKVIHSFTMTKGKLDEWPDVDELERYTAISLQHCDIIEEFPESINCPRLRVFHLNSKDSHLKIPDNFFEGMKELRVLILSGIHLSRLPSSIRRLTKLRMLCLERCMLGVGDQLYIIGELRKLRVLSLSGSDIERVPDELKQLTKLQIFDISNCYKLEKIPSGVISSLISLEELYMRNTLIKWKVEGQRNESVNASLSELRHLNQLTTIDIQIPNVSQLPKNLFFDKLYSYKIVVGDLNAYLETGFMMPEKYEASRFLALHLKDGFDIHSQKGIKMLFERVEILLLEDLSSVEHIFYELNLKGFSYLKSLSIVSNSVIQSLIKPKDRDKDHPEKAFPKLESLFLYNLKNMKEICSCTLSAPNSFGKLKVIKIKLCGQLKNLFLISVARLLTVLEIIEVSECNSLKEIVQSNTNEVKHLELPQLRSMRLQSLSKFIGFSISSGEIGELFHEKVVVSKLERMELSSIQINRIWSDQPSQNPYFQNLTHLDVNGCGNLKYLLSFSMAKCLVKLQSLFVSECEKMERIFPKSQDGVAKMKGSFPNLKNIKLSSMKSLSEIWNSEVALDSFGKLDTLVIEGCEKLVNVFPCYMVKIFQSLCNLRVTNCKSMKAIFDLNDQNGDAINLQDVHLEALPKLEHVWKWNKNKQRFLNLKNLQKIRVHDCDSLENIFPVSVAKFLKNLEYLVVWYCFKLQEIVAEGEGPSSHDPLVFPKLTTIEFFLLPKLRSFYRGALEFDFPVLNNLSVLYCDKLELFIQETADAQRKPLFPENAIVIHNLKSMHIDSIHAESSRSYMGNCRRDSLEEIGLARLTNTEILYSFLHSNPNMKSLSLNDCWFKELVPLQWPREIETLGVVPKLKSLALIDLPDLDNIGFERDPVLQRIESFILNDCPSLVTIAPSSVTFSHLTNLEVVNCKGLKTLMAPSTAKSLGQLSTMKVIKCESLEEIVSEPENADEIDIVFKQLEALELVSLKNLKSFCSYGGCVFEFPSLEKLVVSACPTMEYFSEQVKSTPLLRKIYAVHEKEERWHWEGKLETTIQKMFEKKIYFEGMNELSVSDYSDYIELQQAWKGEVGLQNNWFYSLETLKLEKCGIEPYALPSNVLPYLKSLKELKVRYCPKVKGIFDAYKEIAFQLKKLTLEGLPDLTNVWEKNCQGILSFQNLQQVLVTECHNLETLFPAAIAKNIKKLEKVEIGNCNKLQGIVGMEEARAAEGLIKKKKKRAAEGTTMFEFPRLTSLDITLLPQLTYFYPGRFTLDCPQLKNLYVKGCDGLEVFQSQPGSASNSINKQPLFSDLKAISNLERWMLDRKEISMIRSGQFTEDLQYLNWLYLYFDKDKDVNNESSLPVTILEKAPNLETMFIHCCRGLVIFPTNHEGIDMMLRHLKALFLRDVVELRSIGSDNSSWLKTICDKLQELNVDSCHCLTTLVDSAVSFSHLKKLEIEKCDGLKYLFTSSTAKTLVYLEEMYVKDCKSIEEIVEEQDETSSDGIEFDRLEKIALESLSKLECFYSGNATLKLPSLIEVVIQECPEMENFSQGSIHAESYGGIQASSYEGCNIKERSSFHPDLNDSVKRLLLPLVAPHSKVLSLNKEDVWMIVRRQPHVDLQKLKYLKLVSFDDKSDVFPHVFFSEVPLPSIEMLEVRGSNFKEIFPYQRPDIISTKILSQLKGLVLIYLPSLNSIGLEHSWMAPFPQTLETLSVFACNCLTILVPPTVSFSHLTQLIIEYCPILKYLFTLSTARSLGVLEKLKITDCESLWTIVVDEPEDDQIEEDEAEDDEAEEDEAEDDEAEEDEPEDDEAEEDEPEDDEPEEDGPKDNKPEEDEPGNDEPKEDELEEDEPEDDEPEDDEPEEDEPEEDEMIFSKLKILSLSSLPGLGSFYMGSSALKFPSLEEVSFTHCHNMKMFCHGDVSVPENLEGEINGVRWSDDINSAIERHFGEGSSLS